MERPGQASIARDQDDQSLALLAAGQQRMLVLTEDGQLLLLKPDPSKYNEVGRLQVCGSTWSHPALANGHFYVRDGRQLFCIDL